MKEGQPKPQYKKLLAWGLRAPKMSRARHPTRVGIKGAPVCMIAGAFFPYEWAKLGAIKPPRRD